MLRSCKYCGKIHDTKHDCGRKPVYKKTTGGKGYYFRKSEAWTKKSLEIRERDGYLCQICVRKLHGTIRQFNYDALSVHHIVPVNEDYERRLENGNLLTVCRIHHEMCEDGLISRDEQLQIAKEQERINQRIPPGGCEVTKIKSDRPNTAQRCEKYSLINF